MDNIGSSAVSVHCGVNQAGSSERKNASSGAFNSRVATITNQPYCSVLVIDAVPKATVKRKGDVESANTSDKRMKSREISQRVRDRTKEQLNSFKKKIGDKKFESYKRSFGAVFCEKQPYNSEFIKGVLNKYQEKEVLERCLMKYTADMDHFAAVLMCGRADEITPKLTMFFNDKYDISDVEKLKKLRRSISNVYDARKSRFVNKELLELDDKKNYVAPVFSNNQASTSWGLQQAGGCQPKLMTEQDSGGDSEYFNYLLTGEYPEAAAESEGLSLSDDPSLGFDARSRLADLEKKEEQL